MHSGDSSTNMLRVHTSKSSKPVQMTGDCQSVRIPPPKVQLTKQINSVLVICAFIHFQYEWSYSWIGEARKRFFAGEGGRNPVKSHKTRELICLKMPSLFWAWNTCNYCLKIKTVGMWLAGMFIFSISSAFWLGEKYITVMALVLLSC